MGYGEWVTIVGVCRERKCVEFVIGIRGMWANGLRRGR